MHLDCIQKFLCDRKRLTLLDDNRSMGANDVNRRGRNPYYFSTIYYFWTTLRLFSLPLCFPPAERRARLSRRRGNGEGETAAFVRSGARCGPVATPARLGIQLTATPGLERGERSTVSPTGSNGPPFREWRASFAVNIIGRFFNGFFFFWRNQFFQSDFFFNFI